MQYFRIKNYSKFQHFKNRGSAPWIKMYRSILRDYEFGKLTDIQKGHWLMILLLASETLEVDPTQPYDDPKTGETRYRHTHKALPLDPIHIKNSIGSHSPVNLKVFLDKGFIDLIDISLISHTDKVGPSEKSRGDSSEKIYTDSVCTREWFEQDWKRYPRKSGNKAKAFDCYKKSIGNDPEKRKAFHAKIELMKRTVSDPKFYPYGETFFRNWENLEYETVQSNNGRLPSGVVI